MKWVPGYSDNGDILVSLVRLRVRREAVEAEVLGYDPPREVAGRRAEAVPAARPPGPGGAGLGRA